MATTRSSPRAPTPGRRCTSGCARGSANTQKGIKRFCEELIARVDRAGATGAKLLRADSGFWNTKVFELLGKAGWQYSIGVRNITKVKAAVDTIAEEDWQRIDYPEAGEAQIAETTYGDRRLIVRRTRLLGAQAELFPDWRHFAFTNRTDEIAIVEAEHRDHRRRTGHRRPQRPGAGALPLRPLPRQRRLDRARRPSPQHAALDPAARPTRADRPRRADLRRRLLQVPGRLTSHARVWTLHLPARWPWDGDYISALNTIRALPAAA
jgi:hypothetical protein